MAKNICIFSDGTGQGGSNRHPGSTNVWKLFKACEHADPVRQVCSYDAGLGAPDADWTRWAYNLLSQATGLGISRNIKDCYRFLLEEFEPGDRIFLFGFSRGAYTVRSLGGVLKLCGVPTGWRTLKGKAARAACDLLIEEAIEKVYKHYGASDDAKAERRRRGQQFRTDHACLDAVPHFIGVWDTVRALGLPGTSGIVLWRHAFHDATLDERVPHARQALSIDENRATFAPEIWESTPADVAAGRIRQSWFAGVHSDIGGGYTDDARLSEITLAWIVDEATSLPEGERLVVDRSKLPSLTDDHALGLQHDERFPYGVFREGTREQFHLPPWLDRGTIADPSVIARIQAAEARSVRGSAPYRPVAIESRRPALW